jgi:O-antigen ligase
MGLTFLFLCLYLFFLIFQPQTFFPWLAEFRLAYLFALLGLVAGIFGYLTNRHNISSKKNILLMIYLLFAGLSWMAGGNSSNQLRSQICVNTLSFAIKVFFLYFLTILALKNRKSIIAFLWVIIGFFATNGLISMLMYHSGVMRTRLTSYFGGEVSNSNDLGLIMVMLVPIGLSFYGSYRESRFPKIVSVMAIFIFLYCITRTYSRGAFLALILSGGVMLVLNRKSFKIIILFFALATLIFVKTPSSYFERMATIWGGSTSVNDSGAVESRLRLQREAIFLIKEYPIFGAGIGTFNYTLNSRGIKEVYGAAHNTYLGIAAEMGIVNGILFIILIIISLKELFYAKRKFGEKGLIQFESICKYLIVSLIGFSIGAVFLSEEYNRLLFIIFSLATCLKNQVDSVKV